MLAIKALAVLASALSVAAAPGLSLTVSSAESIRDIDNFKVSTTLTNTGDETLRILNSPHSALSKLPADTFAVRNSRGRFADFGGIKVKYVPSIAAAAGGYTTLEPGATITVEHDLSEAYDLSLTGSDTYEVEPRTHFYLVNAQNEVVDFHASLDQAATANISGRLSKPKLTATLDKRATYIGCSATRQSQLVTAAASAQTYATNSRNYLQGISATTTRYSTWFGTYSSTRKSTVQSHFTAIAGAQFSSYTYDCGTCTDPNTFAYVYSNQPGKIWLCGAFWAAANTGTDSRAGTLVHEASHWNTYGGTDDHAYGQSRCKTLAINSPSLAVDNADSHEYFTENTPFLS